MLARDKEDWTHIAQGGLLAGMTSGIGLAMIMLIRNTVLGRDVWPVLKMASAPILRERALLPGFDGLAVGLGLFTHLGVSALWGLVFAALVYGYSRASTVPLGAVFGAVVWFSMFFIVLPLFGLGRLVASMSAPLALIDHLLFGAALGLTFLPFQRSKNLLFVP